MPQDENKKNQYNRDEDIPFNLPKEEPGPSDEELRAQDRPETGWASLSQAVTEAYDTDETEDLEVVDGRPIAPIIDLERTGDEDDVPFKLPNSEDDAGGPEGRLINKMMTMPHQKSPNVPSHEQKTLAGSDGLDPNPDFVNAANARRAEPTMQSPRVQGVPPASSPTVRQDDRFRPSAQTTQPNQSYRNPVAYNAAPAVPAPVAVAPLPQNGAINGQGLPRRRPGEQRRFRVGCLAIFLGLFVTFCGGLFCVTSIAGVVAYARIGDLLEENIARVDDYDTFQSTFLYDRNGEQLYEVFNEGRRTNITLADMPRDLINATVAIEDDTFYDNIGIDVPATTVALLGYLGVNDSSAGGSTITQQLVRNVLFDPEKRAERSAARKAEEILLAIALTGRKSKDEILELYLNEIYYGNLAYGAEAAAQVLFGKSAIDLTLGESALLAGLPQAPAELDPLNPDPVIQQQVESRWRQVLDEMVDEQFITAAQRDEAIRQGLTFSNADIQFRAPHFTVWVQGQLEDLMSRIGYSPEDIALGGLRVYTTLDLRINDLVQSEVVNQVNTLQAQNVGNGAVVVLKPVTGEVLAMVGSKDYDDDSIDGRVNVTTARRQPGSTMKAFNYAAALERGMTAGDVIWDTPTKIGIAGQNPYEPFNYDRTFHGPMYMRYALANSYNIPAVQTLRHNVGVDYLLSFVARLGVQSLGTDASIYGLSLTLGGGEITLLELTRGYSVFAMGGQLVQTQSILCVLDNDNNIIYQYENSCPRGNQTDTTVNEGRVTSTVVDPRIAFLISDILADNGARTPAMGANSDLYTPGINSAVKTGTTDDYKDNWTVGYTRNVAVGVWVGNSRGEPMVGSSGLTGAAPIWNGVLTQIYASSDLLAEFAVNDQLLNDQLEVPQGISQRQVCDIRALTDPSTQCPRQRTEWFLDSPAGLPAGDGTLQYPGGGFPVPPTNPDEYVVPADPGMYRAVVVGIPEAVGNVIQFPVEPGQVAPPAPKYCRVRVDQIQNAPGAQELLFLAPPPEPSDAAQAERYARTSNLAFLPTIQCTPELLQGAGFGTSYGPIVAQASISSPTPGQIIPEGGIPIIGTVQFDQSQAMYYKLEIRGGQFPNWTTIGDVHYNNNIVNGQLDFLPGPPGLQPGNYELQLVIIASDASILQQPFVVPFSVQ
jgi:penicillin-binding protein 1C